MRVMAGFAAGTIVALGPFQVLFGSTSMIPTIPAHVSLPGLIGNRIHASVFWSSRSRRRREL